MAGTTERMSLSLSSPAFALAVGVYPFVLATGATISMYGLGSRMAASGKTRPPAPATPTARSSRNDSRNLIFRFMTDCIFGLRGSPRIGRDPSASQPELHPPLKPSDHLLVGDHPGHAVAQRAVVAASVVLGPRADEEIALISASPKLGPSSEPDWLSVTLLHLPRVSQQLVPDEKGHAQRPARIACRRLHQMFSNGPSRRIFPFPTQLRPRPGHAQVLRPGARAAPSRSIASSVTTWIDAAMSISRCVIGDSEFPRRPAEKPVKRPRGHRQPRGVIEVPHVHPQRPVRLEVDELFSRIRSTYRGSP